MKKKTVHIISHSHWDREWYMPLERHKMKLLDLMDTSMDLFENDEGFKSFHLDGQTIVLDDYLEIRPSQRERVEKFTKNGSFRVGPFYILQDEFLTSGESNVRNIQVGVKSAKEYGNLTKVGYFPDAFGNAGQMPQLLKQAGMEAIAFGRGVRPVGPNNQVDESGKYQSTYSEMMWESPDGSALLGILFANWYCNGMEIPVEEEAAKAYWDKKLKDAELFASTGELLMMNGCDHQPVQKDLSAAIETAKKLYPDIEFVHSNFEDYIKCVKEAVEEELTTVKGELTSQETDGWSTLVNTCSSHVFLKRLNRQNEVLLERMAEPMAAFAAEAGKEYPHDRLTYAWKILMQNHPHDSICGCSVDQVNKEMEIRFDRSMEVGKTIVEEATAYLTEKIDTSAFAENSVPFVVYNTTGWDKTASVTLTLDVERDRNLWLDKGYKAMTALTLPEYKVVDAEGNVVEATVCDNGVHFNYDLPDDAFRKPYMARQVKVTLFAENVPANGYKTYALVPCETAPAFEAEFANTETKLENKYLVVAVNEDGTLTVTDKTTSKTYADICYFEDTLDAGNEYIYVCPPENPAILTKGMKAEVKVVEQSSFKTTVEIVHKLELPVSADEQLAKEQASMTGLLSRRCHRSAEMTTVELHTFVTLEKDSKTLQFKTEFNNTAKDHRLRVVVPTGLVCDGHYTESVFEVVKRPNVHSPLWVNPSKCEHQQGFTAMNDAEGGVVVGNIGLYEYEILPEEQNAIAVTLLRATGELGDWGVFPTELSQQLRPITTEYMLSFYSGDFLEAESYSEVYKFQTPAVTAQTVVKNGVYPAAKSFLTWKGKSLLFSNIKRKTDGTDLMVRVANYSNEPTTLFIRKDENMQSAYRSNVLEEVVCEYEANADGYFEIPVRGAEIVTVGIR